ncbi:amidase family protein [Streptomyces atratus]
MVEAAPAVDAASFDEANLTAWYGFLADGVDLLAAALAVTPRLDTLQATTLASVEHDRSLRTSGVYTADRAINATTRAMADLFTRYDMLLTPTTCAPNTPLSQLDANVAGLHARGWYHRILSSAGFTAVANATATPTISLPLDWSSEGWPIGDLRFYGAEIPDVLIADSGSVHRLVLAPTGAAASELLPD